MAVSESEQQVLAVLAGQSPGYLIAVDSSAFFAVGLDPAAVAAMLSALQERELVVHEQIMSEEEDDLVVDEGWRITPEGLEKAGV